MNLTITVPCNRAADVISVQCEHCGEARALPDPAVGADSPLAAFVATHVHDAATSIR